LKKNTPDTNTEVLEKLQNRIRTKGLGSLEHELGLSVRLHPQFPNLVLFKYSQVDSPMGLPEVQICRGLILDRDQDWKPVCFPFSKFWNVGEYYQEDIDWNSASVQEKLDGSLCVLWYYSGEWQVSTTGSPDASGEVRSDQHNLIQSTKTYTQLFWETWNSLKYTLPDQHRDRCFMFELMTPENRIVVPHMVSRLVLHGNRSLKPEDDYTELAPNVVADRYGWECVKSYPLTTLDDVLSAAKVLNPMQSEGFVVADCLFRRVKIKSPQYVAIHHLRSELTERRMIGVVQGGERSEILSYFPELTELFNRVEERFSRKLSEVKEVYNQHKDIPDQKEFAMRVKDLPYSGALFAVRRGKCESIETWFREQTPEKIERLL